MTGETHYVLQAMAMQGVHPSERLAEVLISSTSEGCYPASTHVGLVHPTTRPWLTRGSYGDLSSDAYCVETVGVVFAAGKYWLHASIRSQGYGGSPTTTEV